MEADTAVDDPRVQNLVRRRDELGAAFHAGDEQTKQAAQQMWRDHRTELSQRLPWPADQVAGLVAYLEGARQAAGLRLSRHAALPRFRSLVILGRMLP